MAMERARDCEEKLDSRVLQASRDVLAKITILATVGIRDD
jgi:hypothetical protein